MRQKFDQIREIYRAFDLAVAEYRREAACEKGCAFCCTDAGSIDITTLEGLVIRERIHKMPRARRVGLKKTLKGEVRKRETGTVVPCPFLMKTRSCMIYDVRPFACRRIYSLHACTRTHPPRLNRRVMEQAQQAIASLQRLDRNGYSGHISFILHMFDSPRFLETYLAGDFKPQEVMAFGKTHRIVINKMMV